MSEIYRYLAGRLLFSRIISKFVEDVWFLNCRNMWSLLLFYLVANLSEHSLDDAGSLVADLNDVPNSQK